MVRSLMFLLSVLMANNVIADDHETTAPAMLSLMSIAVEDGRGFLSAMETFADSECRKQLPVSIRVMDNDFNGEDPSTHTIIWGFQKADDYSAFGEILSSCSAFQQFWMYMRPSLRLSEVLAVPVFADGDTSKDSVYRVWRHHITDEATYIEEMAKVRAAAKKAGRGDGAMGILRVIGGRSPTVTHMVYFGAKDLPSMINNLGRLPETAVFLKNVADIRTVYDNSIAFVEADF